MALRVRASTACLLLATVACGSRTDLATLAPPGAATPTCADGLVVLASGAPVGLAVGGPNAIAVDATRVYWTVPDPDGGGGGSVMSVPLCGGPATTVASVTYAGGTIIPDALAVDGANVYWAIRDQARGAPGSQVMMVPADGGTATPVASQQHPVSLAVDSTSVYWGDDGNGTVVKARLDGGTPVPLGEGIAQGVGPVVVDAIRAYFWAPLHGLMSVPVDGGRYTTLVSDDDSTATISDLAVADGVVYWSADDADASALMSIPAGGGAATALVTGQQGIGSIATDGANVYWTTCGSPGCATGRVMKVQVGGGTPVVVASGWPHSGQGAVAVDARSVYWTSGSTLMKMTPK